MQRLDGRAEGLLVHLVHLHARLLNGGKAAVGILLQDRGGLILRLGDRSGNGLCWAGLSLCQVVLLMASSSGA